MGITSFTQLTGKPNVNLDSVVGEGRQGRLELKEPLNPPGNWTRFKAALSNIPLLGQIGSLRKARTEVEEYPVRLEQFQTTNRKVLEGFVKDLRSEFGDEIAEMTRKDLGIGDGQPLTARHVTTSIEGAKRAQQNCRSQNNQMVTRLLESPMQGGNRLPGEKDVNDICLDRGMALEGGSWQHAMGENEQKFVANQVMLRCQQLPEHSRGRIGNEQFVAIVHEVLDLHAQLKKELGDVPGMTGERMARIFGDAQKMTGTRDVVNHVREFTMLDQVAPMLDRRNPESVLRKEAERLAREYGVPVPSDGVLKSIGNNMVEFIRDRSADGIAEDLGCSSEPKPLLDVLVPQLQRNVQQALTEHFEALKAIDESKVLSEPQKDYLKTVALDRRMDPGQVAQFEKLAGPFRKAIEGLGHCQGDPGRTLQLLRTAMDEFRTGLTEMQKHGRSFWEGGSTCTPDSVTRLMGEFAQLCVAGMPQDQAQALFATLRGEAMRDFMQALGQSPSTSLSGDLPMLMDGMIQAVAVRSGMSAQEASDIARDIITPPRPGNPKLSPALLLPTMTGDPGLIDGRGVVDGAKQARKLVDKDFRHEDVRRNQTGSLLEYVREDRIDEELGVGRTMIRDTSGATFHINGRAFPYGETEPVLQAMKEAFPDTEEGRKMKAAVSQCMSQRGLNDFVLHCTHGAFGENGNLLGPVLGTTQEAFEQDDGSWIVRSTNVSNPQILDREGHPQVEFDTRARALYSLSYRITPVPGGEPTIEIIDSKVAFDF